MARSGLRRLTWISIHAPREGCDACPVTWSAAQRRISIHAPREGCDLFLLSVDIDSTNFNPRTPRGVRPHHIIDLYLCAFISIHAPREGCDAFLPRSGRPADHFNPRTPRGVRRRRFMGLSSLDQFQSTHPARGATERGRALSVAVGISIHAPREGCDPRMVRSASQLSLFQSTHPARGATIGPALPTS